MQPVVINWAAFAAAIAANFVLGGLWYSPLLFVRKWQAETGVGDQDMGKRMPVALPGQLAASVVTAFVLVHFIRFAGPIRRCWARPSASCAGWVSPPCR